METDVVLLMIAEIRLGQDYSESLPGWAADALVAGIETPALRELAGLPKEGDGYELRRLLDVVAAELGLTVPGEAECRQLLVERWARQIVDGEVAPEVGAARIWAQWSEAGGSSEAAPDSWLPFVNDASDWDELPGRRDEIRASICTAARSLVDGAAGSHRPR